MTKTTVYLDTDLAVTIRQLASIEGRAQAELIPRRAGGVRAAQEASRDSGSRRV